MPKNLKLSSVFLALVIAAGAAPGATPVVPAEPARPRLVFEPCQIEHPLRLSVLQAECATLSVAENPAAPTGRQIGLRITRIPAISRNKPPDPVFLIPGGPGRGAADFYVTVATAFARIQRERDIVLLDQRGTGGSNRLACKVDEDFLGRSKEGEIQAAARTCLQELAPKADVAYYTTSVAVEDLERVRQALGLQQINIYASSYGTRVAQQYVRHHGAHVRTLILDGVVPSDMVLGASLPLDAQSALQSVLTRCAGTAACAQVFGDPSKDYQAVLASVTNRPFYVTVPDPSTGAPTQVALGPQQLGAVLRVTTYSADYAALLPLLLHRAGTDFDFTPLAAQYLIIARPYGDTVAFGEHNSVICAEDVPFFDPADIERTRHEATYMGVAQIEGLKTLCKLWPRGPVDADLRAPLVSNVPALLLSGGADPVTPPAGAMRAASGMKRSLALTLDGMGHGLLQTPCMDRVMAAFVALGAIEGLDVSCTRQVVPPPFFTSLNGPAP